MSDNYFLKIKLKRFALLHTIFLENTMDLYLTFCPIGQNVII